MAKVDPLGHNPKANIWAYRDGAEHQVFPSGAWTKVLFTHHYDPVGFETYNINHTLGTGDFTVNEDGWYEISFQMGIEGVSGGNSREARIVKTALSFYDVQLPIPSPTLYQYLHACSHVSFLTTDTLSLSVYQDSGSDIEIYHGNQVTWLKIIRLR